MAANSFSRNPISLILSLAEIAKSDDSYQSAYEAFKNCTLLTIAHRTLLLQDYWDELSIIYTVKGKLIAYHERVYLLVHSSFERNNILHQLHATHKGIIKTHQAAMEAYYWPDLNEVRDLIDICQVYRPP
eukprot:TCALIF_13728-PA protein Name:"Protein of unknown function" AED:0.41 eAED:0.43 QI:0/-1/0/1/-1/1/1/0/129